jgi:hypothetical protein
MTAGILFHLMNLFASLHPKVTHITIKLGIGRLKSDPVSIVRKHKVINPQIALTPANVSELLVFRKERAIKGCRNTLEKNFASKFRGYRMGAVGTT